jgi:hypothetical protein
MGLFKRLVEAVETIAKNSLTKDEHKSFLERVTKQSVELNVKARMVERQEQKRDRYHWLKYKNGKGITLDESELFEIEVGSKVFEPNSENYIPKYKI